jgi:DNA end-binding protein Ku
MASTVWRGYLTFGLLSIPVRLFRAARAERVGLRRLYRRESVEDAASQKSESAASRSEPGEITGTVRQEPSLLPVQQVSVRKETDDVLPEQSVVKGYEFEKGRFVVVEAEELKNLAPKTSSSMEIEEFVQLTDIDPVYFETSYYVTPEEAGEKAYTLLYRSMQSTGLVAIARFAMHGREHVVLVRPGKTGVLAHTMFFASEVRAGEEYRTDVSVISENELDLAQTLIHSLSAPFEPEKYRDTYREQLESIIAHKVRGQPLKPPATIQKPAEVVDIAQALRRSLANLKKPMESEQQPDKGSRSASTRPRKMTRTAGQK